MAASPLQRASLKRLFAAAAAWACSGRLYAEQTGAAAAVVSRYELAAIPATAARLAPGASYAPRELGLTLPRARALRLEGREGGGLRFSVEGSSRSPATALLYWTKAGKGRRPLLLALDAGGRLRRWELLGREGAEGEFDARGGVVTGRAWRGEEETVTLRGSDLEGRPQLRFHKYRGGRKTGVRVLTVDPATHRPIRLEEFDGTGRRRRLAVLGPDGVGVARELPRALAPPGARPGSEAPAAAARPKAARAPPPRAPSAGSPPPARAFAAPPDSLLAAAPDGAFAPAAAVVRRFGPALGQARTFVVAGAAGAETWRVRRERDSRPLEREEVANELLAREVLRSFYGELFEAPPAVGFEASGRAALIERLPEGTTAQAAFRPLAPKERAGLAGLALVFGLADLGREHLLALPGRRLALV
ncbi:MAG: hypothetical protein HY554_09350, partial [Elusimicrobia bacterium]|nr:hypothetical protein [Elusimicrobiota bacterium]